MCQQQSEDSRCRAILLSHAKVARVVSFCTSLCRREHSRTASLEHLPFLPTTTLYLFLLQYTRLPISVDPIFPARFWVSLLLSLSLLFSFILSFSLPFFRLRYVLSGLASPLHLSRFPDAPFASSCHRSLLPPASYKDVGNLFILASRDRMPRSVEKAAGARLPTRRLCAGGPCSPKYRTRRHSVLGIFHGLFLACRLFSCSLLLSLSLSFSLVFSSSHCLIPSPLPTGSTFPFKRTLVAKFSPLTFPAEYSARWKGLLLHGRIERIGRWVE